MNSTPTKRTAPLAYEQRAREAEGLLRSISDLLEQHADSTGGCTWGHVGDLGHVNDLLERARRFLAGEGG